jgi:hypothetical protein
MGSSSIRVEELANIHALHGGRPSCSAPGVGDGTKVPKAAEAAWVACRSASCAAVSRVVGGLTTAPSASLT